ncbi:Putative GroES-like superfamily, alcohol dehydrogenase-like, NAD(P)-binding domain superfamily [Septoria linicola]|uniref:GroES-like superfamily, alcohol dehydrogenase-like, NAD(P)-binding domain superfamily n=1 Tax=Septoria linicola TaxID=215465 RepID=A0A9Q9EP03_9PEZI|nr:putative GroES-like superfamily, alcohol dehydrogenase-like, NAD(P)-binding domain superfamily [Septoria linicola]USW57149.1 Putative GroES-like superfamily, alcohol dehydrogenase-like, NAD(P)-binding domain superfamily [Septoria linicola]
MKALIADRSLLTRIPNMLLSKSLTVGVVIRDVPRPKISATEILIKVNATALNPIDAKFIDFIAPAGSKLGCDFAGVVAEAGSTASKTWKVGDRVAGFCQGGVDTEYGSFAEYVKAEQDLVWRIPETTGDTDASPTPGTTKGSKTPILIYAGSTAVGLFAIQLAKNAGCTVITTCSPHSFDLVESYGADAAYNYCESNAVEEIRKAFPNITKALDCISEGNSTDFAARVIGANGGTVITLLDIKAKVSGVEVKMIMSFQMLGKAFAWLPPIGPKFDASPSDREALVRFYADLPQRLPAFQAPPVTVLAGGFDAVLEGLQKIRAGKVSGTKLVVTY